MEKFSIENLNCMVDLHMHMDGAITPDSAKMLAKLQGIDIPMDETELRNLIQVADDCSNLNEFLERFAFPCSLLMTKEGLKMAFKNYLDEVEKQGVMYVEIRYAPQLLTGNGLTQEEVVEASLEGVRAANIPANLILCFMRGEGNEEANLENLAVAEKFLGKGVVAVDLAGAEALFTTDKYEGIFKLAAEKGVPFTIHAGEACGPESIAEALKYGTKRIGHGVRCLEDPAIVKELVDKKIPLELCPTSNVCTAIFNDISEYPIRKLMDAGLTLTINTDDPAIENTNIKKEYQKLIDHFGLTKEEVKQFLMNGVEASFAEESLKVEMKAKIEKDFL